MIATHRTSAAGFLLPVATEWAALRGSMPQKNRASEPRMPSASDRREGFSTLQRLKVNGEKLLASAPISEERFGAWRNAVLLALEKMFGDDGPAWLPTHDRIEVRTGNNDEMREAATRLKLTKRTVEMIDAVVEQHAHEFETEHVAPGSAPVADKIDVFVSHSSEDSELAECFVNLLRAAFEIAPGRIRCTSVNGYKLEGGLGFEDALRVETLQSTVFVPLVTPAALASRFTVFEFGARWGSQRRMIPIRARGADYTSIGRPLNSLGFHNGTDRGEMIHATEIIAGLLKRTLCSGAAWEKRLSEFVQAAAVSQPAKEVRQPEKEREYFLDSGILWSSSKIPNLYDAYCPGCLTKMAWLVEGYKCPSCDSFYLENVPQQPRNIPAKG